MPLPLTLLFHLLKQDISVVMAMGDSITAGFGIKGYNGFSSLDEYRGLRYRILYHMCVVCVCERETCHFSWFLIFFKSFNWRWRGSSDAAWPAAPLQPIPYRGFPGVSSGRTSWMGMCTFFFFCTSHPTSANPGEMQRTTTNRTSWTLHRVMLELETFSFSLSTFPRCSF